MQQATLYWRGDGRSLYQLILGRIGTKPWATNPATAALSILLGLSALYVSRLYLFPSKAKPGDVSEAAESTHPLLKKHSNTRSYETKHADYPSIRTFYHPHAHAEKLQVIADLPLLVFIHGLGGSLPQFAPLLGSLVNVAPCFGIDLPGHGSSTFSPKTYSAYTVNAFCDLWQTAVEDICREKGHTKVVLIGHSMGCSISAILATRSALPFEVVGLVAICPKATPPSPSETKSARRFLALPDPVLNVLRMLDRSGGVNSKSVERMAGKTAGIDLRRLQLAFNSGFRTPVWKRSALGCLPVYDESDHADGGLPGQDVWSKVEVPLFLIAGEADTVTKPAELTKIVSFLHKPTYATNEASKSRAIPTAAPDTVTGMPDASETHEDEKPLPSITGLNTKDSRADDGKHGILPSTHEVSSHHSTIVKSAILPSPAAHALMYDHSTYRTVAGLIEDFLARYVSPQLSLGWQLQQLTTSGKWDVKNLEKWKKVLPVSGPIGKPPTQGIFRALKTLREQDEVHTPSVFIKNWQDKIFAVVDISHDSPVYDTKSLELGNIQYHKFPTVSKVPPTPLEVANFIALIDRLRLELPHTDQHKNIGVHCHYGYNRTGFFICSYLVERCGYRCQDALEEFAREKPPGIRHEHFIDTLFMRYCVGLRKASTFGGDDEEGDGRRESRQGSLGSVDS